MALGALQGVSGTLQRRFREFKGSQGYFKVVPLNFRGGSRRSQGRFRWSERVLEKYTDVLGAFDGLRGSLMGFQKHFRGFQMASGALHGASEVPGKIQRAFGAFHGVSRST